MLDSKYQDESHLYLNTTWKEKKKICLSDVWLSLIDLTDFDLKFAKNS